ncbi:MAG: MBL fold metallo-hydrolase, partial [Caldilinea sp.]|nr:MBL fold metallo-hydrolase [Caldilinea sp.]
MQRGLSSALVMVNEHRFMIDCGEGTQRQLLRTGLGFRRLDKILLTHGHLDHILG